MICCRCIHQMPCSVGREVLSSEASQAKTAGYTHLKSCQNFCIWPTFDVPSDWLLMIWIEAKCAAVTYEYRLPLPHWKKKITQKLKCDCIKAVGIRLSVMVLLMSDTVASENLDTWSSFLKWPIVIVLDNISRFHTVAFPVTRPFSNN